MAREILKKQNVTFYKEDEELWSFILELSEKERRPIQNLILTILQDYKNENCKNNEIIEQTYKEEPKHFDEYATRKANLRNMIKK